jgi:hypothetical protein
MHRVAPRPQAQCRHRNEVEHTNTRGVRGRWCPDCYRFDESPKVGRGRIDWPSIAAYVLLALTALFAWYAAIAVGSRVALP